MKQPAVLEQKEKEKEKEKGSSKDNENNIIVLKELIEKQSTTLPEKSRLRIGFRGAGKNS